MPSFVGKGGADSTVRCGCSVLLDPPGDQDPGDGPFGVKDRGTHDSLSQVLVGDDHFEVFLQKDVDLDWLRLSRQKSRFAESIRQISSISFGS